MRHSSTPTELSVRELCILSLMAALMLGFQVAMAALPNIHLTALLIILTAVHFGWRSLYSVLVFVMLEGLMWGFGVWWLSYLYAWPLLCAAAVLLRKNDSAFIWAVLAALFGLSFGALCAIPYLFIGGTEMAFSYWVAGIGFDLVHAAGNLVLTLLLFTPLSRLMTRLLTNPTQA